jgi:hypothetical protein
MSGLDSEVCPCCHSDWCCTDALLGQKQDLVIAVLNQAGPLLQQLRKNMKIRSILDQEMLWWLCIPYLPIQASTATAALPTSCSKWIRCNTSIDLMTNWISCIRGYRTYESSVELVLQHGECKFFGGTQCWDWGLLTYFCIALPNIPWFTSFCYKMALLHCKRYFLSTWACSLYRLYKSATSSAAYWFACSYKAKQQVVEDCSLVLVESPESWPFARSESERSLPWQIYLACSHLAFQKEQLNPYAYSLLLLCSSEVIKENDISWQQSTTIHKQIGFFTR